MIDIKSFLTKESFSMMIEKKVLEEGFTYFDAIIDFSEECDRSPEELLPFMSQTILEKVRKSACDKGLVESKELNLEQLM